VLKGRGGWCAYLLRCRDGSLYAGCTNDLDRRLNAHRAGTASRYTRSRLPVRLVYREACGSRPLALRREAALKALPRRAKLALVQTARPAAAPDAHAHWKL
jgi:putative endonuclease